MVIGGGAFSWRSMVIGEWCVFLQEYGNWGGVFSLRNIVIGSGVLSWKNMVIGVVCFPAGLW